MAWDEKKLEEFLKYYEQCYSGLPIIRDLKACQVEGQGETEFLGKGEKSFPREVCWFECSTCHYATYLPLGCKPNFCSNCGLPRKKEEPPPNPGDKRIVEGFGGLPEYRTVLYFRSDYEWHVDERKGKEEIAYGPVSGRCYFFPDWEKAQIDRRKDKP